MGFVIMVLVLMWLVIWPLVSYSYFKSHAPKAAPEPLTRFYTNASDFDVETTIERGTAKVVVDVENRTYILSTVETEKLIRSLDRTRMNALSVNELRKMGA